MLRRLKHLHASPRDRTASGLRNVTPTLNKPKDPMQSFTVTVLYQQASSVNTFVPKNFLSQKIFFEAHLVFREVLGFIRCGEKIRRKRTRTHWEESNNQSIKQSGFPMNKVTYQPRWQEAFYPSLQESAQGITNRHRGSLPSLFLTKSVNNESAFVMQKGIPTLNFLPSQRKSDQLVKILTPNV